MSKWAYLNIVKINFITIKLQLIQKKAAFPKYKMFVLSGLVNLLYFCSTKMHINEIVLVFEVWSPDILARWRWWCLAWLVTCTSGNLLVQLFLLLQCHKAAALWIVWFVMGRLAAAVIVHVLFTLNHCAVVNC